MGNLPDRPGPRPGLGDRLTRRQFAGVLLASTVGVGWVGTGPAGVSPPGARLTARPKAAKGPAAQPGPQPLALTEGRDGVLYVPRGYHPEKPLPLVLALHGATGSSKGPVRNFGPLADELGLALVVPDSRGRTWDAILLGEFGPDRDFIDSALEAAWSRVLVDPRRVGVAGFSDGATYALALGRANGDLFSGAAAFSPGFLISVDAVGRPPVFISHGTHDSILPIDECSRRIVPELRRLGYPVTYREFDGDHTVPQDMASLGLAAVVARG
jgi:phospholipase/carboxylesterase